ncbi:MAG TPA: hypothetical protein VIH99_00800 [Bdellovibrionota bacterium]|jgi:pectate lyase
MKLALILFSALLLSPKAQAGATLLEKIQGIPLGYGAATTGGCTDAQCLCQVTNTKDSGPGSLRDCVAGDKSKWVVFKGEGRGEIKVKGPILVGSNTTIDGRGPGAVTISSTDQELMFIRGSSNVIVSDLKFHVDHASTKCSNPQTAIDTKDCGGGIMIFDGSRNVWINQSSFDSCTGKCIAVWAFGNSINSTGKAQGGDLISISGNVFRNSYYGVLAGADHNIGDRQKPIDRVTLYLNYFEDITKRSPRVSEFSHLHAFNNVMRNWGANNCNDEKDEAFAASTASGAQLLLESNWFEARPGAGSCKQAVNLEGGSVRAAGNDMKNGAKVAQNQPTRVFNPTYQDGRKPMTTALRNKIMKNTGPRLGGPVTTLP